MNASLAIPATDAGPWRAALVRVMVAVIAIVAIFARDVADMAVIWWNDTTFNHCLIVLPLIGWVAWERRAEVAPLTPRGWWPALVPMAAAVLLWLAGEWAGVALFRHAAVVTMIQCAILGLLGPRVVHALLFPVAALWLLVPFGSELVPPLQTLTAKMAMIGLGWAGVPAQIEGVFITTPHGYFEVAEACAGVRFLIAMLAYAVFVANLCFADWRRRVLFLIVAAVVPILANGVRAWGTIMSAQWWGIEAAAGYDHLIYGWVFFAAVLALVMLIARPFFDRKPTDPVVDHDRLFNPAWGWANPVVVGIGIVALALAGPLLSQVSAARAAQLPDRITAPGVPGWTPTVAVGEPWSPHYRDANRSLTTTYAGPDGGRVELAIVAYAQQGEGREIAGYGQGAFAPEGRWAWTAAMPPIAGGKRDRLLAPGPVSRQAVTWMHVGGVTTASAVEAKRRTLLARAGLADPLAVAVIVTAVEDDPDRTAARIATFVRAAGGVDALVARARLASAPQSR